MAQNVFRISNPGYSPSADPLRDLAAITGYRPEGEDESFAIDLERELMGAVDAPIGQRSLAGELEAALAAQNNAESLRQPVNDDDFMPSYADDPGIGFEAAGEPTADAGAIHADAALAVREDAGFDADAEIDLDFGDLDFSAEPVMEAAAEPSFEDSLLAYATGGSHAEIAPAAAARRHSDPGAPDGARDAPFHSAAAEPVAEFQEIAFDDAEPAGEAEIRPMQESWRNAASAAPDDDDEPVANWSAVTHPADVWQDEPAEAAQQESVAAEEVPASDPFAELARLAASYSASRPVFTRAPIWANRKPAQAAAPVAEMPAAPQVQPVGAAFAEAPDFHAAMDDAEVCEAENAMQAASGDAAFELDMVDLPEEQAALADDLDLPEVDWDDEPAAPAGYGDYDDNYTPAYEPAAARAEAGADLADDPFGGSFGDDFERDLAMEQGFAPVITGAAMARPAAAPAMPAPVRDSDYRMPAAPPSIDSSQKGGNRAALIAAAVAGLALLGGLGVYAMSGKTSGTTAPAVIKADDAPVKIKPENPGGAKIGNQDSAVYEKVAAADADAPAQEKLVSTEQEPVDVAAILPAEQPAAPEAKGVDRIIQEAPADPAIAPETIAVQPKRVKTMVVKPDGSMVLREQTAPEAAVAAPAEPAQPQTAAAKPAEPAVAAAEPEVTFTPPAVPPKPAAEIAAVEPEAPAVAKVAEPVAETVEAAIAEPVAPKPEKAVKKPAQKAAKKPVPAPEQVALAEPDPVAAAPAAGGGWSIQIASQPSRDGAQASYKSLATRYGAIIGGKGVQIIPAQIEGKGTFYRVRIPAGSKEEAAALCARYKSAGGSCFASR